MMKKESFVLDLAAAAERTVLAGRRPGEADRKRILRELRTGPGGAVVVLNLKRVEVLSSSYFLACLWPLWRPGHGAAGEFYPIFANANDTITDELSFVLEHCAGLVWHWEDVDSASSASLLGSPDSYDTAVFKLLLKRGLLTARELHEQDPSIGITAWSTRLGQHHQNRLVRRRKDGKQMLYSLPWVRGNG
jgi:hypothetical protein